tara:strand:+ start:824 stop:1042 length:219 start_codon:yes stop_codon:yes gene_type:complete
MIKNILIIFMIYIIGSLLIAKPDNMEILKQSIFSTKEFIENGYDHYIGNNSQKTNLQEQVICANYFQYWVCH